MDTNSYPHRAADETTELLDWAQVEDPVHFQQRTIERDGKRVSDTQPSEILTGGPKAVFTDLAHHAGTVLRQKDALAATASLRRTDQGPHTASTGSSVLPTGIERSCASRASPPKTYDG
ncbi:hypothetical protein ACFXDH_51530 [Streptomyces sp. NPDC059467]|uniref:hypothetical protein n=1 Tax=Streptomyces sp. NPDC059467 TaxID=3346844 RepID=UPI00368A0A55